MSKENMEDVVAVGAAGAVSVTIDVLGPIAFSIGAGIVFGTPFWGVFLMAWAGKYILGGGK